MSSTHTARVAPERTKYSARLAVVPFYAERLEKRMAKMSYFEQLRSPNWQRRRLEIMSRDEFRCQVCYDNESTLNVHHKHYTKGRMAWEYGDDELVTLCEECHEDMHAKSETLKRIFAMLPVDGPCCANEAMALVDGWAHFSTARDYFEFEPCSPYSFRLGVAASMIQSMHYKIEELNAELERMHELTGLRKASSSDA